MASNCLNDVAMVAMVIVEALRSRSKICRQGQNLGVRPVLNKVLKFFYPICFALIFKCMFEKKNDPDPFLGYFSPDPDFG